MELGRILEEEAMSKKILEIGSAVISDEVDKISRILSWCSRSGEQDVCKRFEDVLERSSRSLARLRFFKALKGLDPGASFDKEILKIVGGLVESYSEILRGYPVDPYGRVPVRSKVDLYGDGIRLRRGYIHMIHMDRAVILESCGMVELVKI